MKNTDILKAMNDIDDKYIEEATPSQFQNKKRWSLKWATPLLAACAIIICFMVYKNMNQNKSNVTIPNPWSEVNTIEEAEKITGFKFSIPETINNETISNISVMDDTLISVDYGENITIRKSSVLEDISGDYNQYDSSETQTIQDVDVTIQSNTTTYSITWNKDNYSYSLYSDNVDKEIVIQAVNEIIESN